MGLMDKAKDAIKGRSQMVEKGIDVAADQVNKRSKGKYAQKVNAQASKLKAQARQLDETNNDPTAPDGPARPGHGDSGGPTGPAPRSPLDPGLGGTTSSP